MRRREFIVGLGGAAAWPGLAQSQTRMRRIGVLLAYSEGDSEADPRIKAFEQGLNSLGWAKDNNIQIVYRYGAGSDERMRAYSSELVKLGPDLIVAHSASALAPLARETRTVPIVVAVIGDLVDSGYVKSLSQPGGNITGFSAFEFSIGAKWIELLTEIAPHVRRVMVVQYANANRASYVPSIESVARTSGVQVIVPDIRTAADIDTNIDQFARDPGSGLIVLPGAFSAAHRGTIIAAAARNRLPAIYPFRYFIKDGGLIAYGSDQHDIFRRAASYVDRILKGERPGDLPVQQPTKFELAINLNTAKALGLTVPPKLLFTADEVFE